jgi:Uma2 family endonuclease
MAITTKPMMDEDGFDPTDPFFYGWREVERVTATGEVVFDMVPLTEEDALHPLEEDHVTQGSAHGRRCRYLADVIEGQMSDIPTALVLADVRVDWGVTGVRPHGPDVAVFLGVGERRDWGTFHVKAEGARPVLVVEVTSPATVRNDREKKRGHYALARIPLYVLVDPLAARRPGLPTLVGYTLVGDDYQEMALDERGYLWLEPVRLWLGFVDGEVVCLDEAGQPMGDYPALLQELGQERQARLAAQRARREERRARQEEHQARLAAEARVAVLEAELRRLRGEGD